MKPLRKMASVGLCMCVSAAITVAMGSPVLAQQSVAPSTAALAEPVETSTRELLSNEAQVVLVHSTLARLNDANLTGNYSILLQRASEGFRQANPPTQMAQGFEAFRASGVDLWAASIYPIRWREEFVELGQSLRIVGVVESRPQEVTFDLGFVFENGEWRLASIAVSLTMPGK